MAKSSSQRTFLRGVCIAAVVIAALVVALSQIRGLRFLEDGSYDARMRWTARPNSSARATSKPVPPPGRS